MAAPDEQVLLLLLREGYITKRQDARVRAALKRGMNLSEAINKVPLVEPVKFASVQARADFEEKSKASVEPQQPASASSDIDTASGILDLSELNRIEKEKEKAATKGAGKVDSDIDVDDIEFDDVSEAETITGFPDEEELNEGMDEAIESAFDSSERIAPPNFSAEDPKYPELGDPAEYQPTASRVQTFDLNEDEGIPLVKQVNELLRTTVEAEASALVVLPQRHSMNVVIFRNPSIVVSRKTLDLKTAEKVANRLKVMARIEAWKKGKGLKGTFKVKHGSQVNDIYIGVDPLEDQSEMITAYRV